MFVFLRKLLQGIPVLLATTSLYVTQVAIADDLIIAAGDTVTTGRDRIHSNGRIDIEQGASLIANSSTLVIGGDWQNDGNFIADESTVEFNGDSLQAINAAGEGTVQFKHLNINNAEGVSLLTPIKVQASLEFSQGHLVLNERDLTLRDVATIENYSPQQFVVSNGSGSIIREALGNDGFLFPIGISRTQYSPILVSNNGEVDDYTVNVRTAISHGLRVAENALQLEWKLTEVVPGGSNLTLTPMWQAGARGAGFSVDTSLQLGAWAGSAYDLFAAPAAVANDSLFSAQFDNVTVVDSLVVANQNAIQNSPPVFNAIANLALVEDSEAINVPLVATDVDNDAISFSIDSQASDLVTLFIDGANLRVAPKADANGQVTLTVNATSAGETVTQQFVVDITPVNDSPSIALIADQSARENLSFSLRPGASIATDIDSENLVLSAQLTDGAQLPSWLAFSEADASFQGTPPTGSAGDLSLSIIASDGEKIASSNFLLIIGAAASDNSSDLDLANYLLEDTARQFNELKLTREDSPSAIRFDLVLPENAEGEANKVVWRSSRPDVLSSTGTVVRMLSDVNVVLTSSANVNGTIREKRLFVTVAGTGRTEDELIVQNFNMLSFVTIRGDNVTADAVRTEITLPSSFNGANLSWRSEPIGLVNVETGELASVDVDTEVNLIATQTLGASSADKTIPIILKPAPLTDSEAVIIDATLLVDETISLANRGLNHVVTDLNLSTQGSLGSAISWRTETNLVLSPIATSVDVEAGVVLGEVTRLSEEATVSLIATVSLNDETVEKRFLVTILANSVTTFADAVSPNELQLDSVSQSIDEEGTQRIVTDFVGVDGTTPQSTLEVDGSREVTLSQIESGYEFIVNSTISDVFTALTKVIRSAINANGTSENMLALVDEQGVESTISAVSLNPQTTTSILASGELVMMSEDSASSISAVVSAAGDIEHKLIVAGVSTTASSKVAGSAVLINAEGGVQTTARIVADDMSVTKIEALAQPNGFAEHRVSASGISTQAEFQLSGAQTAISAAGEVTSTVNQAGADITVTSSAAGLAQHSVVVGGVATTAQVTLPGAQTTVTPEGSVNTSIGLALTASGDEASQTLKAAVDTASSGVTSTGFSTIDSATGVETSSSPTLSNGQLFPAGSVIEVKKTNLTLVIVVQAPLDANLIAF